MSYTSINSFSGPTTSLPAPALSPPEAFIMGSRKYEESSKVEDGADLRSSEEEVRCITNVLWVHSMLDGLEFQTILYYCCWYKQQDTTSIQTVITVCAAGMVLDQALTSRAVRRTQCTQAHEMSWTFCRSRRSTLLFYRSNSIF